MPIPGRRRQAGDNRWRRLGRAAAVLLPLLFIGLCGAFWLFSGNIRFAAFAAASQAFAVAVSGALIARAAWGPRLAGPRQLNVMLASMAAVPALMAALLAAAFGLSAGPAAAIGAGVGLVAGAGYASQRRRVQELQTRFPMVVDTLGQAERLRAATRAPGDGDGDGDPAVPADSRAMQRLNHARALTSLAMREGDHDRLVEALPLPRAVFADRTLDPAVALLAADDLVNAESMLAQRSRDDTRYAAAVGLYARLVGENPEVTAGQARLHEHRAGYYAFVEQVATDDAVAAESAGNQAEVARACERAREAYHAVNRELTAALKLTGDRAEIRPQYLTMLGAHLCLGVDVTGEDRLDEGIGLCRQALALPAGRTRTQRPLSELSLAQALVTRWDHYEDDRDLDEAEGLLRRLMRLGNPVEARAGALLLDIAVRREEGR
jgi:hypothetical protein